MSSATYRRILLKVSGEMLAGEQGYGIQPSILEGLASEIASQIELHRVYGGVVPEIASRNHSLHLRPLVEQALTHAGVSLREMDAFAATSGPGLASSLLVGATAAKAMAAAAGR